MESFQSINDNNDEMALEPRLQEYMKMIKYYKSNNMKPSVPFEKTFQITQQDISTIKQYIANKKSTTSSQQTNSNITNHNFVTNENDKIFPSKIFRDNDPRVTYKSNVNNNKPVKNFGMFAPDDNNNNYYDEDAITNCNVLIDMRDVTPTTINRINDPKISTSNRMKDTTKIFEMVGFMFLN